MFQSRKNGRRNGNRLAVRSSPKAPAARPMRTFSRTLRQTQILPFNNVSTVYATIRSVFRADPRSFVDWEQAATPFEMFRVKRLRAFMLPASEPTGSLETLLRTISSTTVWTAPDYTYDEITPGNNIKSYQNARFHSVSLNGFKKIIDTDVRLNSVQGGVLPPTTWLPTQASNTAGGWDPTQINYTGFQLYAENPTLFNVAPSFQGTLSLVLEIDVEFKQPGFVTPATAIGQLPGRTIAPDSDDEEQQEDGIEPVPRKDEPVARM